MIKLPTMNPEVVSKEIQKFILNKVRHHKKTGVVLGLSGGIDSSVVAVLCLKAFEGTPFVVKGYYLPHSNDDNSRVFVNRLIDAFPKIEYQIASIYDQCTFHVYQVEAYTSQLTNYQKGNCYSRVRATFLSAFAEKENKVLSGTGNRDEDYGVGYYTMFGDGAVHMNPIGCLSKRLVYQMAEYLDIPLSIIKRPPTAGLEPNQTDLGDLGYQYSTVEIVIESIHQKVSEIDLHKILEAKGITFDRNKFADIGEMVEDILSRHLGALVKSQIINPPVPTVTLHYSEVLQNE